MFSAIVGMLVSWPFLVRADTLNVTLDGTAHTLTVDAGDLRNTLSSPWWVWAPVPASGTVSARSASGSVWTIDAAGLLYLDGVPVTPPAGTTTAWATLGVDFETVTLAAAATCRWGVPGHYAPLTLAAGTYAVTAAGLAVADPAVGVKKTLDCQVSAAAKATQFTLIGLATYAKYGTWRRYSAGKWVDAASTPAALLQAP